MEKSNNDSAQNLLYRTIAETYCVGRGHALLPAAATSSASTGCASPSAARCGLVHLTTSANSPRESACRDHGAVATKTATTSSTTTTTG